MDGVSDPVIKGLLDDLCDHDVFSPAENKSAIQDNTNTTDRARWVIKTVMGKGERASWIMIDSIKKRDKYLYDHLGLISSATAGGAGL